MSHAYNNNINNKKGINNNLDISVTNLSTDTDKIAI